MMSKAGEEAPGEVTDRELVGDRADELDQPLRDRRVARGGRRESQPGGCDRHLEGLVAQATAKVVRLVDHEEIEAVAEPVHVPVGTLEGGDGQRGELVSAIAVAADGTRIGAADVMEPLREQDPRRDEAQRARPGTCHRCEREAGLAAPGRQDDGRSALRQLPGPQRRLLVRPQLDRGPGAQRRLREPDVVRERQTPSRQLAAKSLVAVRGCPVGLDAWVPEDPRDGRGVEAGIEVAQEDRTAVEEEEHGREASNRHAVGAMVIRVVVLRCWPVPPVRCNDVQRVVTTGEHGSAQPEGPAPACSSSSGSTQPSSPTSSTEILEDVVSGLADAVASMNRSDRTADENGPRHQPLQVRSAASSRSPSGSCSRPCGDWTRRWTRSGRWAPPPRRSGRRSGA